MARTVSHALPHSTLTANIRKRRGAKVAINVPVFQDTKTLPIAPVEKAALPNCICTPSHSPLSLCAM